MKAHKLGNQDCMKQDSYQLPSEKVRLPMFPGALCEQIDWIRNREQHPDTKKAQRNNQEAKGNQEVFHSKTSCPAPYGTVTALTVPETPPVRALFSIP